MTRAAPPALRTDYISRSLALTRCPKLQAAAKQPGIGKLLDEAMLAIEKENPGLKGVLPKDYARESLDKRRLGELIDLVGTIGLGDKESRSMNGMFGVGIQNRERIHDSVSISA